MCRSFSHRRPASAARLSSRTSTSLPPTTSSVGAAHPMQRRAGQIGPSAARDDRPHEPAPLGGREQGGRGPRRGAEVAERQTANEIPALDPVGGREQPPGEKRDVEAQVSALDVEGLLLRRQQVDQERGHARFAQLPRDELVARALPAAAAAVGEDHEALDRVRDLEIPGQMGLGNDETDFTRFGFARCVHAANSSSRTGRRRSPQCPGLSSKTPAQASPQAPQRPAFRFHCVIR